MSNFIEYVIWFMLSTSIAIAMQSRQAKTFSIKQIPHIPVGQSGLSDRARAYRKAKSIPSTDIEIIRNNTGEVTATPTRIFDEYLFPVKIGGQTFAMVFDTGSSDLWVFSSHLTAAQQKDHRIYEPSSNSSKKLAGETWRISYGFGSERASGVVYTDTVAIGTTLVQCQAVEVPEKLTSKSLAYDGILGLGFSSINQVWPNKQNTFFDNVKGDLALPLFTVTFKHRAPGSIDFGYIDATKYAGLISYTEVDNSSGFWGITVENFTISNGLANSHGFSGMVDTGTSLLILDDKVVTAYYDEVEGSIFDYAEGGHTFTCSTTLPDITFFISGYNAVVPGNLVNLGPIDDSGTRCLGGVQGNDGLGPNVFGDVFLKSQFVVFDSDGPRMGFASQA